MNTVRVHASRAYDVMIGAGGLALAGRCIRSVCPQAGTAAIISDTTVLPLYGARVRAALEREGYKVVEYAFPAGEAQKNLDFYGRILNFLVHSGLSRTDVLIALGGGVVGDMAGFAASTFLRGIDFVQIPTTLLAAVDSSVGGKTAIDLDSGKNLAGTFAQPALVLCDPDTLSTLPEPVYREGCAEVIKYGVLGSEPFFRSLCETPVREQLTQVITACVEMKRDAVESDELDRGERRRLNLGHSIGHAVESCADYTVPHGYAVAIGMVRIMRAAVKLGYCKAEALDDLIDCLKRYELPIDTDFGVEELYAAMLHDKKIASGKLHLVVPERIGSCRIVAVTPEQLRLWLAAGEVR